MGSRKRQMHLANSLMGSEIYDPYGVTGNSTKRLLAKKLLSESGRFKPRNGQYPHSQGLADLASTGLGLYSNYLANQEDNEVMAAEQKDYSRGVNEAMNMMRPTSETIERMREPYDDDLMKQEQVAKRTRDIGNQQDFINELEKPGHPGPALGYAQRSMEEKQDDWISAMNEARSNADPVGTGDYTQRETPGDMDGAIQSMMSSNNRRLQNIGATLLGQRMKNQFSNNLGNFEEKERIKKKYRDPIRNPIDDYESKLNLKNRLAPPTQFEGWVMDQEGMGESTLHDVRTGKKKVPSELIEKWKKLGGAKVEVNVIPDQKVPVGYYVKKGPGGNLCWMMMAGMFWVKCLAKKTRQKKQARTPCSRVPTIRWARYLILTSKNLRMGKVSYQNTRTRISPGKQISHSLMVSLGIPGREMCTLG
jgi:hypothetical protein